MKYSLILFIFWRILLCLIVVIGASYIKFSPRFPYSDIYLTNANLPPWIWTFANFDGVHYLGIVKNGYSLQYTQVFFPLYPLIIIALQYVTQFSSVIAGLLVSNVFFLTSLIVFYQLLRLDYKKNQVRWIITFLIFSPTSFYFGSLYTESLFLFLVFSSFYLARKKKWFFAGVIAAFASATRFTGVFLLPALLWEWYRNKVKSQKSLPAQAGKVKAIFSILQSQILYIVPLGLVVYMIYLQINFGDWLYFWHAQPLFGAQRAGESIILLPQVIWRYIKMFMTIPISTETFWISFSELSFTLGSIFILFVSHKKMIRTSYLIFSWFIILLPTMTGTLSSMPRYILCAFPIFIFLGLIKNKSIKVLLICISFILLSIFTVLFTRGHWVA